MGLELVFWLKRLSNLGGVVQFAPPVMTIPRPLGQIGNETRDRESRYFLDDTFAEFDQSLGFFNIE